MILRRKDGTYSVAGFDKDRNRITLSGIATFEYAAALQAVLKEEGLDSPLILRHLAQQKPLKHIVERKAPGRTSYRVVKKNKGIDATFKTLEEAIAFRDNILPNKFKKLLEDAT